MAKSLVTEKAPLVFQPNAFQLTEMPLFENHDPPRYLFRIHTPNCLVQTSLSAVIPRAAISAGVGKTRDIFKLPPEDAARILNVHLRWWKYEQESECNLVCWTSSLLFAVQYGLHRARKGNRDNLQLSQITLLILDTRNFPREAFIKDLEIIRVFSDYSDPQTIKNLAYLEKVRLGSFGNYFGEYLSQGYLNIEDQCAQTSMQDLVDTGLFKLLPELEDRTLWRFWASRVVELRAPFKTTANTVAATHREVRTAIIMAERLFDERWTLPLALMLIALRPRIKNDSVIVEGFASMYSTEEVHRLSLGTIRIDGHDLPEVKQFEDLIESIHHRFEGDTNSLGTILKQLSLK